MKQEMTYEEVCELQEMRMAEFEGLKSELERYNDIKLFRNRFEKMELLADTLVKLENIKLNMTLLDCIKMENEKFTKKGAK